MKSGAPERGGAPLSATSDRTQTCLVLRIFSLRVYGLHLFSLLGVLGLEGR